MGDTFRVIVKRPIPAKIKGNRPIKYNAFLSTSGIKIIRLELLFAEYQHYRRQVMARTQR